MATTTGTTLPMKALAPAQGEALPTMDLYAAAAAVAIGDVLIMTSGKLVVDNSAPSAGTIVGVAGGVTGGTLNDANVVNLALPGVQFTANVINNATDYTGVYATCIGIKQGIIESADGAACIDINNTTQMVTYAWYFARQKGTSSDPTQASDKLTAGVGPTNPRVVFTFLSSLFNDVA